MTDFQCLTKDFFGVKMERCNSDINGVTMSLTELTATHSSHAVLQTDSFVHLRKLDTFKTAACLENKQPIKI
jgi:hypothetical protein